MDESKLSNKLKERYLICCFGKLKVVFLSTIASDYHHRINILP